MSYRRYQALMMEDQSLDFEGTHGFMWTTSWRYVNCGHVYDSVVQHNRLARQEKVLVLPGGELDDQDDEVYLGAESFVRLAV